jgi:CheY-like chemotaxis protein
MPKQRSFFDMLNRDPEEHASTRSSVTKNASKEKTKSGFVKKPNVLLVDDDLNYCRILKRVADISSVPLTFCTSVDELGDLHSWNFDVVIMDYDLGAITGFELTRYLESKTQKVTPVILISGTKRSINNLTPGTICQFIHKSTTPLGILDAATSVHGLALLERAKK